jgi:hypothetical protein
MCAKRILFFSILRACITSGMGEVENLNLILSTLPHPHFLPQIGLNEEEIRVEEEGVGD